MHERVHMEHSFKHFFKNPLCSALIVDSGHHGVLGAVALHSQGHAGIFHKYSYMEPICAVSNRITLCPCSNLKGVQVIRWEEGVNIVIEDSARVISSHPKKSLFTSCPTICLYCL